MEYLINIIYIVLYEMVAVVSPLPIEAPMFFIPVLPRIMVMFFCGLGKGIGSYILFISGGRLRRMRFFQWIINTRYTSRIWLRLNAWSERFGKTYGFAGFILCQAIPGLPMRSPIYSAAVLELGPVRYAIGSGVGAMCRCAIVYGGYHGIRELLG